MKTKEISLHRIRPPQPPHVELGQIQHQHQAVMEQMEADRDKARDLAKEKRGDKVAKAHAESAISHLMHGEIVEALIAFLSKILFKGEESEKQTRGN